MAPTVRYRQTVEAVALVTHGADVSELARAHDAVVGAVAERLRLDRSEVVVRWAATADGVEYRATISESDGPHPPVTHRPGMRGSAPLGEAIERAVDERTDAEHRAEVAP